MYNISAVLNQDLQFNAPIQDLFSVFTVVCCMITHFGIYSVECTYMTLKCQDMSICIGFRVSNNTQVLLFCPEYHECKCESDSIHQFSKKEFYIVIF